MKARLLQRDKDIAGMKTVLEEAAAANPEDVRVLSALGRVQIELKELDRATATYEAIRARGGADTEVLETLVKLYETAKESEQLASVLADLAARIPDDLNVRVRLAKLQADAGGRLEKVEHWAREALFIDVANEEARTLLLAAFGPRIRTRRRSKWKHATGSLEPVFASPIESAPDRVANIGPRRPTHFGRPFRADFRLGFHERLARESLLCLHAEAERLPGHWRKRTAKEVLHPGIDGVAVQKLADAAPVLCPERVAAASSSDNVDSLVCMIISRKMAESRDD